MTENTMDMTAAARRAAPATVNRYGGEGRSSSDARRSDGDRLVQLRAKHPKLAAAADDRARQMHRNAVRLLGRSHREMNAAATMLRQAKVDGSPLLCQRAATKLAKAQSVHDFFLRECERLQASLPDVEAT